MKRDEKQMRWSEGEMEVHVWGFEINEDVCDNDSEVVSDSMATLPWMWKDDHHRQCLWYCTRKHFPGPQFQRAQSRTALLRNDTNPVQKTPRFLRIGVCRLQQHFGVDFPAVMNRGMVTTFE